MDNDFQKIQVDFKPAKNVIDKLNHKVAYKSDDYGMIDASLTGEGVKIAIIDTGYPEHADVLENVKDHVNLADNSASDTDLHGHATMLAGIIAGNSNTGVTGIARKASILSAKVSDDENHDCYFSSIVAGVLWAVVKKADVILLALGSKTNYQVLHSSIEKAYESNICIIVADEGSNLYPAAYKESLAFRARPKGKIAKKDKKSQVVDIAMPNTGIYTTYGSNKYSKVYGSSFAAAIGAGLVALIIEKKRKGVPKKQIPVKMIYKELLALKA